MQCDEMHGMMRGPPPSDSGPGRPWSTLRRPPLSASTGSLEQGHALMSGSPGGPWAAASPVCSPQAAPSHNPWLPLSLQASPVATPPRGAEREECEEAALLSVLDAARLSTCRTSALEARLHQLQSRLLSCEAQGAEAREQARELAAERDAARGAAQAEALRADAALAQAADAAAARQAALQLASEACGRADQALAQRDGERAGGEASHKAAEELQAELQAKLQAAVLERQHAEAAAALREREAGQAACACEEALAEVSRLRVALSTALRRAEAAEADDAALRGATCAAEAARDCEALQRERVRAEAAEQRATRAAVDAARMVDAMLSCVAEREEEVALREPSGWAREREAFKAGLLAAAAPHPVPPALPPPPSVASTPVPAFTPFAQHLTHETAQRPLSAAVSPGAAAKLRALMTQASQLRAELVSSVALGAVQCAEIALARSQRSRAAWTAETQDT